MLYTIVLLVAVPILLWVLRFYWSVLTTPNLPPGPFPLPFIGNLHLLSTNMHISLENLAKKYGNLMTIYFGTERTVIVSCPELARDMFVRQATIFGGRTANLPYGAKVFSNDGRAIVFRHDMSTKWKMQRKLFHSAVKSFGSGLLVLESQVCDVVEDLLGQLREHEGTVTDIGQNVRLCIANIVCHMTLGTKYKVDDEEFKLIVKAFDTFQRTSAPGHLVDAFPILRNLPFKYVLDIKEADELRELIVGRKYREHKSQLGDDGDARDLTEALLKHHRDDEDSQNKLTEEDIEIIVSDIIVAGLETSSATILWGILYLARHPEIQDAILEEMKQNLEPDTFPTFRDRRRLPFLQATIAEIYRYSSIVPLLLPHRAMKDASVGNYIIPENTIVMVNAHTIHHSSKIWQDPHTFIPKRFLDETGDYSPPDPTTLLPFGEGKRSCLGKILGELMVFVTLARMLYAYHFTLVSDENTKVDTRRQVIINPKNFELFIEKNDWS